MAAEANVEAEEEVDVMTKEWVNATIKIHTNLQSCILTILPKVKYIPMIIGISSVGTAL